MFPIQPNSIKYELSINYKQTLKALLSFEIENGAKLKDDLSIDEVIEQFMDSDYTTIFDLKYYFN